MKEAAAKAKEVAEGSEDQWVAEEAQLVDWAGDLAAAATAAAMVGEASSPPVAPVAEAAAVPQVKGAAD